jgi:hypothetical protein
MHSSLDEHLYEINYNNCNFDFDSPDVFLMDFTIAKKVKT